MLNLRNHNSFNQLTMQITDKNILNGKTCPYCNSKSEYIDSSYVYGKSYGMIFICKPCDAFVGVHHRTTKKSLGRLANKELRAWKKKAHMSFDSLWKRGIAEGRKKNEVRKAAYNWLSKKMSIQIQFCHIGMFDIEQCKSVVEICKPFNN